MINRIIVIVKKIIGKFIYIYIYIFGKCDPS